MTPMHSKLLLKALEDNIQKFEKQFGEIKIHGAPNQPGRNIGFESGTDTGSDKD